MGLKRCQSCERMIPISEFYKHPKSADGLLHRCKECHKTAMLKNRYDKIEYYRQYDRDRGSLPHRIEARRMYKKTDAGKQAHNKAVKKWVEDNKLRRAAMSILNTAITRGKVKRLPCFLCGEKAHAHHPDYDRPLDVIWLCPMHHRQTHALVK